jgi:hypothetical protein
VAGVGDVQVPPVGQYFGHPRAEMWGRHDVIGEPITNTGVVIAR